MIIGKGVGRVLSKLDVPITGVIRQPQARGGHKEDLQRMAQAIREDLDESAAG